MTCHEQMNCFRMSSGSQKLTMPLQLLQNATQQSDHHTQQCQLQKLSQSHQAIAHQHMSTKCQKQQPDVDRDLAAQSDQIQDATEQSRLLRGVTATEASDHSSESIPGTGNPMIIPSKSISKQRFSIRIQ